MVNTHIIISVVGISFIAFYHAAIAHKPLSPIIIGSYILLLILSILDIFGGPFSDIAGGLALLALVYNLINATDLWAALANITGSNTTPQKGAPGGGGTPTYR